MFIIVPPKARSFHERIVGRKILDILDDVNGFIKENKIVFHEIKTLINDFFRF
jgi:hypothetical protein